MKKKLPREEQEGLSEEDQKTAEATRRLMQQLREESLPASEKGYIWTRVEERIQEKEEIKVRRIWYAVAASVVLLLVAGLGYLQLQKGAGNAMQQLATQMSPDSGETRLVLSGNRTILLSEQNSSLVYEQSGTSIRIDSSESVTQEIAGQEYNTLVVPYGKRSVVTLADGSKIWLNSGSKLVYPAKFDADQREVFLEGQAYFSVSHAAERPFFVHTDRMKIQVYGTEFDVSAYADDQLMTAVLVNGSIELTLNRTSFLNKTKKKLVPGNRAVLTKQQSGLSVENVNVEEYTSWKDGYLLLTKASLSGILKKLSRYYQVDISMSPEVAGTETFSGRLDLQDNVGQVLDIVAVATSLRYTQSERRYVLRNTTINQ